MRRVKSRYYAKLDNAAIVFPSVISAENSSFFRVSATMDAHVDTKRLQKALDTAVLRFPYYRVRLRQGAFWMYLDGMEKFPYIEEDTFYPCLTLKSPRQGDFLFRVLYLKDRITLEISHILTDGFGASVFLRNIVAEYLRVSGYDIPVSENHMIFDMHQEPRDEETLDAFHHFYDPGGPKEESLPPAYQLHARHEPPGVSRIITGITSMSSILDIVKPLGVSITEYLTAVLIFVYQGVQLEDPHAKVLRPVRINVPANLRRLYPVKTLRNFSLYTTPEIDPNLGHFSFEEILQQVHHYMKKSNTKKYIKQQISRNVGGEINPLVRMIPLPIKSIFLSSMHQKFGESQQTICFSNLGRIELPDQMSDHISRFDFILTGSPSTKSMMSATGYKEKLYISFGRNCVEPIIEREFFLFMQEAGLEFYLESNNQQPESRRQQS